MVIRKKKINNKIIRWLLFVILLLSSCYSNSFVDNNKMITKNKTGNEIIRCIVDKDKESLNNLFCKKVKDTDYLNNQIDFIFGYIDNQGGINLNSTGEWIDGGGHGSYSGGRKVIDLHGWNYDKDILIGQKKYSLQYMEYNVIEGHKEYEGVTHIMFVDSRNLLDLSLEKINIAKNDRTPTNYLGIGIFNTDINTYKRDNVVPKEMYENEEYAFSFEDLEEGRSNW